MAIARVVLRFLLAISIWSAIDGVAANSAEYPTLQVAGPEELAVSADTMQCASGPDKELDVPDVPPTAFRWPDGTVTMIASNRQNFRLDGPALDDVKRLGCDRLLQSTGSDDPAEFRDQEWLTALYSKDGRFVLGFVHNEYHGEYRDRGECRTDVQKERECWYASATIVESSDGGQSFKRPQSPANVVLSLPYPYAAHMKRAGVFMPKVVGGQDGKVYVFASFADRNRDIALGQCVARGTGDSTGGWEVWNGSKFEAVDPSPYGCFGKCKGRVGDCTTVIPNNMFSIKYIPSRQLYVAVGVRRDDVIYRFSSDLVSWSPLKVLMPMSVFPLWKKGDPPPNWYFSLLDPKSSSRNFDTLEDSPYLYFVRFRVIEGKLANDRRDILRVPVIIQ
jgi:hypothetical protein